MLPFSLGYSLFVLFIRVVCCIEQIKRYLELYATTGGLPSHLFQGEAAEVSNFCILYYLLLSDCAMNVNHNLFVHDEDIMFHYNVLNEMIFGRISGAGQITPVLTVVSCG